MTKNEAGGTMIPTRTDFDEVMLVCPECGCEYIHPVGLKCNPAGESGKQVTIRKSGFTVRDADLKGKDGVEITLLFECEFGHLFRYVLRFHEGFTFVERTIVELAQNQSSCQTIWRT